MSAPKRILVPLDFSEQSIRALAYAKILGEACGASLDLLLDIPVRHGCLLWMDSTRAVVRKSLRKCCPRNVMGTQNSAPYASKAMKCLDRGRSGDH